MAIQKSWLLKGVLWPEEEGFQRINFWWAAQTGFQRMNKGVYAGVGSCSVMVGVWARGLCEPSGNLRHCHNLDRLFRNFVHEL